MSKIIKIAKAQTSLPQKFSVNGFQNEPETEIAAPYHEAAPGVCITPDIFRLLVKNGEYVYARPDDIIMIESCDHLVKVYLVVDSKIKQTIRHNTLKDFLLQLPKTHFMRISRFCAVNIHRLSGGNCNEQIFEFDFKISVKLKHSVSHTVFNHIGK